MVLAAAGEGAGAENSSVMNRVYTCAKGWPPCGRVVEIKNSLTKSTWADAMKLSRFILLSSACCALASCAMPKMPKLWPLERGRADGAAHHDHASMVAAQGDPVQTLSTAYAMRHVDAPVYGHNVDPMHQANSGDEWSGANGGVGNGTLGAVMSSMSPGMSSGHGAGYGAGGHGRPGAMATGPSERSALYAIHLASYTSVPDLHQGWRLLSQRGGSALGGLSPRVEVADLGDQGIFQRLKAGPLYSHADAAARCTTLNAMGLYCQVTDFAGADF